MAGFAKISILGALGADVETRYTPNGAMVVAFSVAVNGRPKNGEQAPPTWYRVSCWDRLAERIDKLAQQGYVVKGKFLLVDGMFEPREFQGNDGSTRISYDITMTDFQFVGGGDRQQDGQGRQSWSVQVPERASRWDVQQSHAAPQSLDDVPFD